MSPTTTPHARSAPPYASAGSTRKPQAAAGAILRFWRDVELFNLPSAPTARQDGKDARTRELYNYPDELLPWADPVHRGDAKYTWSHVVYLGVASTVDVFKEVVSGAAPGGALQDFETQGVTGDTWLAKFTLDETGSPISRTYVRASFGLAIGRIRTAAPLDGISDELKKLQEQFEARHLGDDRDAGASPRSSFGIKDLRKEVNEARAPLGDAASGIFYRVLVKSSSALRSESQEERGDIDSDFFNSFFLDDLDRIITRLGEGRGLGQALAAYLGPEVPVVERVDVLSSTAAMSRLLSVDRLPTGRWPTRSDHHLALAQQAAVFESLDRLADSTGLVAVNGPPGTGKSTLLFDVIADVVVRRARRIAGMNHPRELFSSPLTAGGLKIFPLEERICGNDGIVVTSSNNTAVENITRELPGRAKIESAEYGEPGYFPEVAQSLFAAVGRTDTAWGLAAAALGKKRNRAAFVEGFFRGLPRKREAVTPRPATMKSVLEAADQDGSMCERAWLTTKEDFLKIAAEVDRERERLRGIEDAIKRMAVLLASVTDQRKELAEVDARLAGMEVAHQAEARDEAAALSRARQAVEVATAEKEARALALDAARNRLLSEVERDKPSFWERWAGVIGIETARHKAWRERKAQARSKQAHASEVLSAVLDKWKGAVESMNERETASTARAMSRQAERERATHMRATLIATLEEAEGKRVATARVLDEARATGLTIPDTEFWTLAPQQRHLASVWVDARLDRLRSTTFLAALRLHEATMRACAGRFIANFRAVCRMLARGTKEPIDPKHHPLLWRILFFCVPVVSTTLASFDRLFEGLEEGSLGWVLFDEAGQATPQSVVGALWRARRAVVVGDPLQIEPVMTVPASLVRRLAERHVGPDELWSPTTQSAQTIADRTMRYGAWVGASGEAGVWTGLPLRAHRRCASPMFDIANRIAYDGQMVQARSQSERLTCVLGESAWFDVRGEQACGHVVAAEITALAALFESMSTAWPHLSESLTPAQVYVISPFKTVAKRCERLADNLGDLEKNVECGTVHAFQGKEAEIVVIVLGSTPGPRGAASRRWASSKPNLLNVAVTRAKLRIYVIGDREAWSGCRGFDEMAAALETREPPFSMPTER